MLLACGCVGDIGYTGSPPPLDNSVSPRRQWKAAGTITDPARAIDGNLGTLALANPHNNAALTVDLAKACIFNMVVIDHGSNEYGFARRIAVSVSLDGKRFTRVHTGMGARRVTLLSIMKPTLARYIRLEATMSGPRPWAVAEVYFQ